MRSLMRLASLAGLAVAQANMKAKVRIAARRAVTGAVALVFFLSAFGFGLIAAFLWLARELDPLRAALLLMTALLLAGLILLYAATRPIKTKSPLENPVDTANQAVQSGLDRLKKSAKKADSPLKNPVVQLVALAALIGYLFGRK